MPNINEMLLKLEGFQYSTSLYLNMGYQHTQLIYNTSNLFMIILSWVYHFNKRLPMENANYPDIFQQKMNDLFRAFEFIHAYIDNLLILKKVDWTDHVQKLELNLN